MFSQTTEYALRAMASLALSQGELVPTTYLAEQTKVPGNYLAKVLQQLSAAKLIKGRRGVGGGYQLVRAASETNLLDIIRAVGSLNRIHTCPLGIASHGTALCPLHRTMDHAAETLMNLFDGVTLQNLVDDPSTPSRPLCNNAAPVALSISIPGAR